MSIDWEKRAQVFLEKSKVALRESYDQVRLKVLIHEFEQVVNPKDFKVGLVDPLTATRFNPPAVVAIYKLGAIGLSERSVEYVGFDAFRELVKQLVLAETR
jgi:hypothetical protein